MIQWLGEWLKEIIFIILFATFVDLMLPNSTMQRYVKVVISLFILLTILSPIVHLLNSEIDTESMNLLSSGEVNPSRMKPLEAIMKDSSRLQADYEDQALEIAEERLAAMVKEKIEKTGITSVNSVIAKLKIDNQGQPTVDSIQIVLSAKGELLSDDIHRKIGGMEEAILPVKPVVIQIDVGKGNSSSISKEIEDNELTEAMERIRENVARQVKEDWKISPDKISVKYEIGNE